MDLVRFACAWVVACLPVKHHQPSLALTCSGPYTNTTAPVSLGQHPLYHWRPRIGIAVRRAVFLEVLVSVSSLEGSK
jgi:hypothetical protein